MASANINTPNIPPKFLECFISEDFDESNTQWSIQITNDVPVMRILSKEQWETIFDTFGYKIIRYKTTTRPLVYRKDGDVQLLESVVIQAIDADLAYEPPSSYIAENYEIFKQKYPVENLTPDDIQYICDQLYSIIQTTSKLIPMAVSKMQAFQLVDVYRRFLSNPKFKLTKFAIPNYINHELHQILKSRVENGDHVGIMATDAMGAPITQSVLNTRHKAGSGTNAQRNIDSLTEILNISQTRKNPVITVYFTKNINTFDEVASYKHRFVSVYLSNITENYEFMDPEDAERTAPWTSLYLAKSGGRSIPKCSSMMRLYLSKDRMFEHRVNIVDVAIGIEQFTKDNVIAIPSGTMKGIVDIYPIDAFIQKNKDFEDLLIGKTEQISQTYLVTVISNYITKDEIFVSGIREITSYTPSFLDITGAFKTSTIIDKSKNLHRIYFDMGMIYKNGISSMKLIRLIEKYVGKVVGYTTAFNVFDLIKKTDSDKFPMPTVTELKDDHKFTSAEFKSMDRKIVKFVHVKARTKIDVAISKYLGEIYSKLQSEESKTGIESKEICEFRHYYGVIEGNNFEDVITVPGLDLTRTYSNDFYKTFSLLGVEATKNLLYIEGHTTLDSIGEYLTRSHLSLIVTSMLHYGFPVGTTYINMKKTGVFRPITLSSSQRAYENLILGAMYNVEENMAVSVSAAISVGLKIPVGTGMRNIEIIKRESLTEADMKRQDYGSALAPDSSQLELDFSKMSLGGDQPSSISMPEPSDVKSVKRTMKDTNMVDLNIEQIPDYLKNMEKKVSIEDDVLRYGESAVEYDELEADEQVRDVVEKIQQLKEQEYMLEPEYVLNSKSDPSGLKIKLDFLF